MRILFIYFNVNVTLGLNNGLTILSAVLKNNGHQVRLTLIEDKNYDISSMNDYINDYAPDIIGISLIETQVSHALHFLESQIFGKAKIILGGPYPTMNPTKALTLPYVDAVFIGEAETTLLDYINDLEEGTPKHLYQAISFTDLETLPMEDKDLFPINYLLSEKNHQLESSIGRGCAYSCTYCINRTFLNKYTFQGSYIRMKIPEIAIEEILPYIQKYPIYEIAFIDDDFLIYSKLPQYQKTLERFYLLYKSHIHLPFIINTNPLSVNRNNAFAFREAGGIRMRIGIESSERIRTAILKRPITDSRIVDTFHIANDLGVKISTYNMIGIPEEGTKDILDMLNLNATQKPESVKVMTFYPFTGTPLYDYCERKGLINKQKHETLDNYESESCLNYTDHSSLVLRQYQIGFSWMLNALMNHELKEIYFPEFKRLASMPKEDLERFDFFTRDKQLSDQCKDLEFMHYYKKTKSVAILWQK